MLNKNGRRDDNYDACSDGKLLKMAGHGGNSRAKIFSVNPLRATTELK